MANLYLVLVQIFYLVAIGATGLYTVTMLGLHPKRLKLFLNPQYKDIWIIILACLFGLVVTMSLSVLLENLPGLMFGDESSMAGILKALVVSFSLLACFAIPCYPEAVHRDGGITGKDWKVTDRWMMILFVATIVWSYGSFSLMKYLLPIFTGIQVEVVEQGMSSLFDRNLPFLYLSAACFALLMAVFEEVIFRGGVMGLLEKLGFNVHMVVILSSLLWAFGHAGVYVTPHGIKEFHIFGLGIIFGLSRVHFGIKAPIFLHLANNFLAVAIGFIFPSVL